MIQIRRKTATYQKCIKVLLYRSNLKLYSLDIFQFPIRKLVHSDCGDVVFLENLQFLVDRMTSYHLYLLPFRKTCFKSYLFLKINLALIFSVNLSSSSSCYLASEIYQCFVQMALTVHAELSAFLLMLTKIKQVLRICKNCYKSTCVRF